MNPVRISCHLSWDDVFGDDGEINVHDGELIELYVSNAIADVSHTLTPAHARDIARALLFAADEVEDKA